MLEHDVLVLATYQCSSRGYAGAGGGGQATTWDKATYCGQELRSRLEWAGLERAAEEVWLAEWADIS